jgi:hypothetical protein
MKLSPREFMKMRRPERFSDTAISKKGALNRSLLEYKLDAITSNSQEQDFQTFCTKLAQYEIAPNLRLQTGPSGGGDSKADSENYPVSDFTQLNYWEGLANETGEKWAIAISANKDWITKVKKDAKGITETNRDYKRIFYITNQFAKDKKRAEVEDTLAKELSIPVTIFDRTWIMDRVFLNNRQKLAIEELNLGEGLEDEIIIGPNDAERSKEFTVINKEIEEALSNAIVTTKIINQALDAALLARGMGKPRAEVDGLFDRAIRMASKFGSSELLYSIKYEKAWTTFFWFEDYDAFIKLYEELEAIAASTANIYTLERQHNLGNLLWAMSKDYSFPDGYVEDKRRIVRGWLTDFANDETKPSASHQAKILLAIEDLFDNAAKGIDLNKNFIEIGNILKETERLIGFPYEAIIALIQENDDVFGEIPEYENLINLIIELDTKRKGEIPAAKALLNYGLTHLEANRHFKAIEYIGRSLIGLYKKESKWDFIHALYFIAFAYEAVGLLWAARGSLIHAASYATNDLKQFQKVDQMQYKCCRRLKEIELRLGRVGYALEWHEADLILSQQLATTEEERGKALIESIENFSGILGCLLLKSLPSDLPELEKLPDTLNRLELDFGSTALLYLLGGESYLPQEFWQYIGDQSAPDFFNKWADQPARKDLSEYPNYYLADKIVIQSNILGTHFIIETKNSSPGVEVAEMIVSALEAYLSTAITMNAFGKVSEFKVILEEITDLDLHIKLPDQPSNGKNIKLLYKHFNPHLLPVSAQREISQSLNDIVIRLISETIGFSDAEKTLKELIVDQHVDQRSFNFLSPLIMLGNVLGHNPRRSITQWIKQEDHPYKFDGATSRIKLPATYSKVIPPDQKEDFEIKGHQRLRTLSVINEALWDGHVWRGFAFAIDQRQFPIQSPTLYLMFDARQKAIEIFKDWKETFGGKAGEKIRIAILKGIDADHPYWYKGLIGTNTNAHKPENGDTIIFMTKISTMTPDNPRNLEGFLDSFSKFGYFNLAPCYIDLNSPRPEMLDEFGFTMKELAVRDAWEVGLNDVDMTAIQATDNPVIPAGIANPPILEVLKKKRSRMGNLSKS